MRNRMVVQLPPVSSFRLELFWNTFDSEIKLNSRTIFDFQGTPSFPLATRRHEIGNLHKTPHNGSDGAAVRRRSMTASLAGLQDV
jgi:hypothetical protein